MHLTSESWFKVEDYRGAKLTWQSLCKGVVTQLEDAEITSNIADRLLFSGSNSKPVRGRNK